MRRGFGMTCVAMRCVVLAGLVAGCKGGSAGADAGRAVADSGPEPSFAELWAPDAGPPADAAPPAPGLPEVAGASRESGAGLYVKWCARCHGPDGRGQTEVAKGLARPPTNLATVGYLCRTTDARPFSVPSEGDVEGALARGTHKAVKELAKLGAKERRSLTLFVRSLSPEFLNATSPLFVVPRRGEAKGGDEGRMVYLAAGCWRCHGVDGAGDVSVLKSMRWNGLPLQAMTDLRKRDDFVCGSAAEDVYRVVALGMSGEGATIMPRYNEFLGELARPMSGTPEEWTKALSGRIEVGELEKLKAWLAGLPTRDEVMKGGAEARSERAAGFVWEVVGYVEGGLK